MSAASNTTSTPTKAADPKDAASGATDAVNSLASTKGPLNLDKKAAEDVAGSLKIHVKLALEIDIQITARIKGDIAIGIL